ncbi:glycosyltransferase, MGT family [Filimonas lacunae]|uniref:Glycosyltransferase, MGT family n=1 Tax=Filimonas lacunae TaxID=477680 RepID=A0A173M993_9BACT|nr:nucleotide disphospho-sugar-binding domain-containing protein [Filimonas lacunae]BAV04114.1 zeaxanthin glucosyl transferase [Filimonas lacunae]SIT15321.1 glycosyltransferase, MGT family [Filimonas lacunae]
MAKYAFVVPPLTGHINPTISVGTVLLQYGHEVAWISLDEKLQQQLPPGGQLLLIQYDSSDEMKKQGQEYLDIITRKNVYGIESVKFLYEEVLIPLNRYMYDGIIDWLERYQPDVVINDHQLFAGAIAAYNKGICYATSVTAPAAIKMQEDLPMVHQWEADQIIALQKELGVQEDKLIACSERLTLVFTSRAFFGEMVLPDWYRFTGPVLAARHMDIDFPWEQLLAYKERPRLLISIGTTFDHAYKKDFFTKVAEAFRNETITVVLVSDPDLLEQWPDNFIVQKRVPQLDLLPYMSAVLCHAGHNTVCETLMQGLPLVVVPIAYDQSYVAGRVVQVNAGVRLNYKRCKAAHIKEAVWQVIQDKSYKEHAGEIKASFEQAGGTGRAVRLLEGLLTSVEYQ